MNLWLRSNFLTKFFHKVVSVAKISKLKFEMKFKIAAFPRNLAADVVHS